MASSLTELTTTSQKPLLVEEEKESELTESVRKIIGQSCHVVVYGFADCNYRGVWLGLKSLKEPVLSSYNCDQINSQKSIDGHDLVQSTHHVFYKRAMLTVVLENCKRKRRGEAIIPILFCVTSSHVSRVFSPESANFRTRYWGPLERPPTAEELNLAYKLCYDSVLTPEIQMVSKETFIFVKTFGPIRSIPSKVEDTGIRIDDTWHEALKEYHANPKAKSSRAHWREWMLEQLKE